MVLSFSSLSFTLFVLLTSLLAGLKVSSADNFYNDVNVNFGGSRAQILDGGNTMTLSLDRGSGSGFQSKSSYLYGKFSMRIKLVAGNSAGTVSSFYLHSGGSAWDEIDFEFLGNLSGDPYKIHTNIFTGGKGNREEQFFPWFDPTSDFHTYTILWNPHQVVWSIDGTPIRMFKNMESMGVPFPKSQPMYMFSSLWDAEDWATRGGRVKTDWSLAPFVASFSNYVADGNSANPWYSQQLDVASQQQIRSVQSRYRVYSYCTDSRRFPQGFPRECSLPQ